MVNLILQFYMQFTKYIYNIAQLFWLVSTKIKCNISQEFTEKLGIYDLTLKSLIKDKEVVVFHAASVGEFNAIKPLLSSLDKAGRFLLITTATRTGAIAFSQYKHLSENIYHVFLPLDTPQAVTKFLNFWKPNIIILVESEIWPILLTLASKTAKICIINGHLSYKSFKKWSWFPKLLQQLLQSCCFIGTSNQKDFDYYKHFANKVYLTGNIKYDALPLTCDKNILHNIQVAIGNKHILVCISTHPGEEKIILRIYSKLLIYWPTLLLIIAPRHPIRGIEIMNLCQQFHLKTMLRVNNEIVMIPQWDTQVYICNTFGEIGLLLNLTKLVFLGGSFIKLGGHNFCEPAKLGCAIVTGPYTHNFAEMVEGMKGCNGLVQVYSENEFFIAISELLQNPDKVNIIGANAKKFVEVNSGALDKTLRLLLDVALL